MRDKRFLACLVVLGIVALLNLPLPAGMRLRSETRDNIAPFQNIMSLVIGRGRDLVAFLMDTASAGEERRQLITRVAELEFQIRAQVALERDNKELRRQLGFRSRQEQDLVLCEVVARGDATGWWQTIRLNRGGRSGIRKDMAVVSTDGLIGRVREVSSLTCTVLLITDPGCKVACKFSRTDNLGIAQGTSIPADRNQKLEMLASVQPTRMDYISADSEIRVGDEVVTSGLGGVYPEGLLVGHAVMAYEDSSGLYQHADIAPAARMGVLRYAFVVMPRRASETIDGAGG